MDPQRPINSPESLYRKFERSFNRRASYEEYQIDWVFDCAVTAWHLVDWVAEFRNEPLNELQKKLKEKCPELAVCEQIANGAKHLILDNPTLKPFDIKKVRITEGSAIGVSKHVGRDGNRFKPRSHRLLLSLTKADNPGKP